jgi:hypothetical protein
MPPVRLVTEMRPQPEVHVITAIDANNLSFVFEEKDITTIRGSS